ncbi:hypothetical protein K458DRAFT_9294 [Lentithecium fluviatile CBS 122367]|uniref:Uncharacterized protein n=1 Tax=Lentithecium fluviatile CBS 122367 TaxID=1168545 RepID=A0A6G1JNN0_9PLEO|nr:hypothetical protein K458DRAFT_9294 [Lentithecium fluviatile CBS 122367]
MSVCSRESYLHRTAGIALKRASLTAPRAPPPLVRRHHSSKQALSCARIRIKPVALLLAARRNL